MSLDNIMYAMFKGVRPMAQVTNNPPMTDEEIAAFAKTSDDVPLVAIGPRGFETNEKGEPVNMRRSPMVEEFLQTYAEMSNLERTAFRMGLMYAGSLLIELSDHHYELTGKLQAEATRLRAM